ncbi:MAG TPA: outer membrane protein transport protein [Candidatus Ozemobacteraceae bacterium]|nr:outer membrane protein transport protein [Candidatus Ozemobacteraceae bacterium]
MHSFSRLSLLFVLVAVLLPGTAQSAGYLVREHSTSGLSSAFAGVHTGAHDLADMFFNPATLMRHEPGEAAVSVLQLEPEVRFRLRSATTAAGGVIGGFPGGEDAAPSATIPALYASIADRQGWRFGLAVNAPWGLKTSYAPTWVGRYHALDSDMQSLAVMPVAARRLDGKWRLGIGLNIQSVEAKLSNAVDYGSIAAANGIPGNAPTLQDGIAELTGDSRDAGYVIGLLCDLSPRETLGVSFRSAVRHRLEGTGSFAFDQAGMAATLNAATGIFAPTAAHAHLTTPEIFGLGYSRTCGASWTLMLDVTKTFWHRYGGLTVQFDNPAQPDAVTAEGWRDVWFTSAGVRFQSSSRLAWRAGVALDRSPIPDNRRTPRIPGSDSRQVAIGAEYRASDRLLISAGIMRLFYDEAPIDLRATVPGNLLRGNLAGDTDTSFDIYGIQAIYNW